jgi:hypothetical protein
MVATDVQISMFGGLNSANTAPAPTVFHETWVFDGKRWTHRQDIGPGPRWGHAMAYDLARRSIVLFGGLPIFKAPGDAELPQRLLGDTWEHIETDAAPVPPPAPVEPDVIAITLSPTAAAPGAQVTATITLNASSLTDTQAFLAWLPKNVFDQKIASGTLVADDVTFLALVKCPAGIPTISTNFFVPASAKLAITILALGTSGAGGQVDATLTII